MTTASSSSSSGAGSQRGWWERQESSSNNPVYNSVGTLGSTNPPAASSVYEELPHEQRSDQLPLTSTFSSARTTTTNVLYASTGGKDLQPCTYPLEVYKFAPLPEPVYVDKKAKCTCSYEAAILIMALLVLLLAGAALVMSLCLWLQVIPLPTQPTVRTTSPEPLVCSACDSVQIERDEIRMLMDQVKEMQAEVEALTNEATGNVTLVQSRLADFINQLKVINNTIHNRPPPIVQPSASADFAVVPLQECQELNRIRTSFDTATVTTASIPIINSDGDFLVQFSCSLQPTVDHGLPNGTTIIQLDGSSPPMETSPTGLMDHRLSCLCYLAEDYPAMVNCVEHTVRCPSSLPYLPTTFSV